MSDLSWSVLDVEEVPLVCKFEYLRPRKPVDSQFLLVNAKTSRTYAHHYVTIVLVLRYFDRRVNDINNDNIYYIILLCKDR